MSARPLRILMVSAEVESLARTGGLGDVAEALSVRLAHLGAEVILVTPLYGNTKRPRRSFWWDGPVPVRTGWGANDVRQFGVLESVEPLGGGERTAAGGSLRVLLLHEPYLFGDRNGIYADPFGDFGDNELRFAALSRGALEVAGRVWGYPEWDNDAGPDVIHAHDWHAALSIIDARGGAPDFGEGWKRPGTVFTIHNLAFQGMMGESSLDQLGIPRRLWTDGILSHKGIVNLMKGAIVLADRVTTVSPTYAREMMTPKDGFGLDGLLRYEQNKVVGVENGIDMERFDPATDRMLPRNYDANSVVEGKGYCREDLAREVGFSEGGPIFATVSRLTQQKGIDLFLYVLPALVARGARVLLVGTGDAELEDAMRRAAARYPGRVAARIAFDPDLARRVYAGSDFFVVPSRYEPCGLTQMYAMRYGSLPVVTAVGGLRDTVQPIDPLRETGTGLVSWRVNPTDLLVACEDAIELTYDHRSHVAAMRRAMARDSSWDRAGEKYLQIYRDVAHRP